MKKARQGITGTVLALAFFICLPMTADAQSTTLYFQPNFSTLDSNNCNVDAPDSGQCGPFNGSQKRHQENGTTTVAVSMNASSTIYATLYMGMDGATYGGSVDPTVSFTILSCVFTGQLSQSQKDSLNASSLTTPVLMQGIPLTTTSGACTNPPAGTAFQWYFGTGGWNGRMASYTNGAGLDFALFVTYGGSTAIDWGAITVAPIIDWEAVQFVATSSSLFANSTTTLEMIAAQCDDAGNIFSRGLCYAASFLFVPNPSVLNAYAALPELASTKFPFTYIVGVSDAFNGLVATSTANIPTTAFGYHDVYGGIASSSPFGNFLPDVTILGTSTIYAYISPTLWSWFQNLISLGIWLSLGAYIFFEVRNKHVRV